MSFVTDLLALTKSRVLARAAQFTTGVIIARTLGVDGRGLVTALVVPTQLVVTLSELGVRQSTAYEVGKKNISPREVIPTLATLAVAVGALGMGLCLLYYYFVINIELRAAAVIIAISALPFTIATKYASGVLLGEQRIAEFSRTNWISLWSTLILTLILVSVLDLGVEGALLAIAGGATIAFLLVARTVLMGRGALSPPRLSVARALWQRGLVYAGALFLLTVNYKIGAILLARYGSVEQVGVYTAATTLAEIIWEIPAVLTALVFSRSVGRKGKDLGGETAIVARISIYIAAIGAVSLAIIAPKLIVVIYGRDFQAASQPLYALLPGVVAFVLFKILNVEVAGSGRPWVGLALAAPAAALNVALGMALVPRYGATGAALAASISYVIGSIAYVLLYARMAKIRPLSLLVPTATDFTLLGKAAQSILFRLRKR